MKVLLVFRSGAQIPVDVEKLAIHKAPADEAGPERIDAVQWNDTPIGDRLLGVVPSEVVCVVELGAAGPPEPFEVDELPAPTLAWHTYRRLYQPDATHPDHPGVDCTEYEASEVTL